MKNSQTKSSLLALAMILAILSAGAALVDTDGHAVTNETALGDIDMGVSTYGDLSSNITNGLLSSATAADTYQPKGIYALISALVAAAAAATNHTDTAVAAAATASTNYTDAAVLSAAAAATNYTDAAAVAAVSTAVSTSKDYTDTSTNAVIQHVDGMDTSYFRFNTVTNVNQSVQYVYTDANTTQLQIRMPETGQTKDWLVYVLAEADLNLILPPATYWGVNESVTNPVPAYTPTALYFSQVTQDTFSFGRKEFVPITVSSARDIAMQKVMQKSRQNPVSARKIIPTRKQQPSASAK